jgi:hypothetical protein
MIGTLNGIVTLLVAAGETIPTDVLGIALLSIIYIPLSVLALTFHLFLFIDTLFRSNSLGYRDRTRWIYFQLIITSLHLALSILTTSLLATSSWGDGHDEKLRRMYLCFSLAGIASSILAIWASNRFLGKYYRPR